MGPWCDLAGKSFLSSVHSSRSRVSRTKVLLATTFSPKSTKGTFLRWASFHTGAPEFFPAGKSHSPGLFPSRFFLDSEPASPSQISVYLHAKLTEPFGVTLSKVVVMFVRSRPLNSHSF